MFETWERDEFRAHLSQKRSAASYVRRSENGRRKHDVERKRNGVVRSVQVTVNGDHVDRSLRKGGDVLLGLLEVEVLKDFERMPGTCWIYKFVDVIELWFLRAGSINS